MVLLAGGGIPPSRHCGIGRGRNPMPRLPAARRMARGGRLHAPQGVRRPAVLGQAGSRLRTKQRTHSRIRARPGRARREPHRPDVHRRPLRRLPLRRAYRAGLANRPLSSARDDGLELRDVRVSAAVRCAPPANKPTPAERDRCRPWSVRELELLERTVVIVCLGAFAWNAALGLVSDGLTSAGRRGRVRASGTGPNQRDGSRCWAAFTPANRTPSPAVSRDNASTP